MKKFLAMLLALVMLLPQPDSPTIPKAFPSSNCIFRWSIRL